MARPRMGPDHPKDAARLGDLGKRVFGPKLRTKKGVIVVRCSEFPRVFLGLRTAAVMLNASAKSLQNVQKISRKASEIIENQPFHLSKAMYFKGKVQTKFKSTHKVCKKFEQTAICQNIIAESWGGPPQMQYFDISQFVHTFCTLCVYF